MKIKPFPIILFGLLLLVPLTSFAKQIIVSYPDTKVTDAGAHAVVATNNKGLSCVVWQGNGVHAQLIDQYGQVVVSDVVLDAQALHPAVSTNGESFVIVWDKIVAWDKVHGVKHDVFAAIIGKNGQFLVPPLNISSGFGDHGWSEVVIHPNLAQRNGDGRFVVVWNAVQSGQLKIFARLFSATGNPLNRLQQLNSRAAIVDLADKHTWGVSRIAVSRSGNVVVAWAAKDAILQTTSVFVQQLLVTDGVWGAVEEWVIESNQSLMKQLRPMVTINDSGDVNILWMTLDPRMFIKKYSPGSGWSNTLELPASSKNLGLTALNRGTSKVLRNGELIVAYTATSTSGDLDVFLEFFDRSGLPTGKIIRINQLVKWQADEQRRPALAVLETPAGITVNVTWEMVNRLGTDKVFIKSYLIK